MKKIIFTIACLALSVMMHAQSLYVGTYNLRVLSGNDEAKGDRWAKRCQVICDQMNFEHPDIFGTQEAVASQLRDILHVLDDYASIGVGREDGKEGGEFSAILYNKKRLKLLDSGNFWLSEHPEKPGLGWDAAYTRICTYGKFKDKDSHKAFFFINLHMDHQGVVARRESAKLVISKIRMLSGGLPVILTGDFNVDQRDEVYQIFVSSGLLKDSYTSSRIRVAENGTFNAYNPNKKSDSRIDHVLVSPSISVDRYGILTDCYWTADSVRHLPSDHYPVLVRLSF